MTKSLVTVLVLWTYTNVCVYFVHVCPQIHSMYVSSSISRFHKANHLHMHSISNVETKSED